MVLHFTMLYQFRVTAKDSEIDGLRVPAELLLVKNRSYTLVRKYCFFSECLPSEYVIHLRLCYPGQCGSLGYEWEGWRLQKGMMRPGLCLVPLHVSVSLWPSKRKPRRPFETHSAWHCHYWTIYKYPGLQDQKTPKCVSFILMSG